MNDYFQPALYHFSQDSIALAKRASIDFIGGFANLKILDICAGSGVVGLELNKILENKVDSISFIEKQKDVFEDSIAKNVSTLKIKYNVLFGDFRLVKLEGKFDIILCNPPYFSQEKNRLSDNIKLRTCTHFEASFYEELIEFVLTHKKKDGRGYILYRQGEFSHDKFKRYKTEKIDSKTSLIIL